MTQSAHQKMTAERKGLLAVVGLVFGGALLMTGFYVLAPAQTDEPLELVSFSGLPEGTTGDVRIESANGSQSFAIGSATPVIGQDAQALTPPYRLYAALKLPGDRYRDFIIAIDKNRSLSAVLDGFDAWDPVGLTIGQQTMFKGIPADWSGKLQLDTGMPDSAAARACVEINSGTGTMALCHDVGGVRAS